MIRSLWIAKTGLDAQQTQMDVISNNLANVSTTGFKRSRAVFEEMMYQTIRQPGAMSSDQTVLPSGMQIGTGVRPVATERIHTQGNPQQTGNAKDVAIIGNGFFQVTMPDGTTSYTRDGSFQVDQNGQLVTSSGFVINPAITLPANYTSVNIARDGTVTVMQPGSTNAATVGQPTRHVPEPDRAGKHGREPVRADRCLGRAEHHGAGPERRRHAAEQLRRSVERERGGRTGEHDPDPARVRNQQQGGADVRPDAAASDPDGINGNDHGRHSLWLSHRRIRRTRHRRPGRAGQRRLRDDAQGAARATAHHSARRIAPGERAHGLDLCVFLRAGNPLFEDRRPRNVGDILTIVITENINASKNSGSNASRAGNSTLSFNAVPRALAAVQLRRTPTSAVPTR
jgi:flagellar basal body rod protein FlgG